MMSWAHQRECIDKAPLRCRYKYHWSAHEATLSDRDSRQLLIPRLRSFFFCELSIMSSQMFNSYPCFMYIFSYTCIYDQNFVGLCDIVFVCLYLSIVLYFLFTSTGADAHTSFPFCSVGFPFWLCKGALQAKVDFIHFPMWKAHIFCLKSMFG